MDGYQDLLQDVVDAIRSGELAQARRQLLRAGNQRNDPGLVGAIRGLEVACLVSDDDGDIEALMDSLAAEPDHPIEFHHGVGSALSDAGHSLRDDSLLLLAEAWFRRLSTTHGDAATLIQLSIVLERLDRLDQTVEVLQRALALDDDASPLHLRLAQTLADLGKLDLAAAAYRRYLEREPSDAHEWISLAIVECDAGRAAEADQAYWRAAGLEPSNVSLHYNWLITALRGGDEERAADALRRLQAVAPGNWQTRMAEARLLAVRGDAAGAVALASDVFTDCRNLKDADDASGDLDGDDDADADAAEALTHVAESLFIMAQAGNLVDQAQAFAAQLFDTWTFSDNLLRQLRSFEPGEAAVLGDYWVMVDALYPGEEEPMACLISHRVFATSEAQACELARAFEERCGADRTRIEEVEQLGTSSGPEHPGVAWRSDRLDAYPADEYGGP